MGLFLVVVGGGSFILGDDRWRGVILGCGEWWWVYFGWWCVVVGLFWVVMGGGEWCHGL